MMMASQMHNLLMDELEAVRNASEDRRAATVKQITDLFLAGADCFTSEQLELFDDVFVRLIDGIERRVLIELANNLAPVDSAPVNIVRQLAKNDEIQIAGPVLAQSNRLDVTDLIEIAKTMSQAHLLAISDRKRIEQALTAVLLDRGNEDVLCNVASNAGASLSEADFGVLVGRAENDERLTEKVGLRADIPPHLFERLVLRATKVAQERLLTSINPVARPELHRILTTVAQGFGVEGQFRSYEAARTVVAAKYQAGTLVEADLLDYARTKRCEELVIALALLCSVSVDIIDRLMDLDRPDAMLIACRSAGLDWSTAREIMSLQARDQEISEAGFRRARENFNNLTKSSADRILHFWQSRQGGVNPPASAA
jgi:uncharacterized protein (DUF2336 family)